MNEKALHPMITQRTIYIPSNVLVTRKPAVGAPQRVSSNHKLGGPQKCMVGPGKMVWLTFVSKQSHAAAYKDKCLLISIVMELSHLRGNLYCSVARLPTPQQVDSV
jgi:hypothetical protein